MTKKTKLGPVSPEVRRAYRARMGSDRAWGRPTEPTAKFVWSLFEDWLPPVQLDDLLPKRGKRAPASDDEHALDVHIAKQSLVVALDAVITAGDRDAMLTKNALFDALAQRWSRRYRRAALRHGARISCDMRVETVERALRELLVAGVRFDTLWRIVTGPWSRSGLNPFFAVRRSRGKRHALGYHVDVNAGSTALQRFESVIEADKQYRRRRQKWPLLLADDWTPRRHRPIRQSVCAERPYNVVNLEPASERVLSILEGARVQFNVEVFRDDYETISAYLDGGHRPSTRTQWRNYRALKGFVASYRRLYRQTEAIPVETIDLFGSPVPILRTPWIRSRFFRARNRRYHAANFWPERVHKEFRKRWFSFAVHVPGGFDVEYGFGDDEITGGGFTPARTKPGRYVERDIVTSQIQTLAVFLGLEDLEALATSERPTLKEWLADRLWTQHRELLADGYEGEAGYTKLVAFAKAHLMRFYGGDLGEIIRKCGRNTDKYGPGWKTSRGLWATPTIKPGTKTVVLAKSGVTEAVERATEFFLKLPPWIDALETFLEACRTLAETRPGGVAFHDPLDGAEVRWDHAQRGVVHVGHEEIEVHPPGANVKLGFLPVKPGAIDRTALKRFVTPCLTHLMDAFFSGLVLDQLHSLGADVVALHDAWMVPERLPVPEKVEDEFDESMGLDGSSTLKHVIEQAGSVWFTGLGGLYDQLVTDLGDHGTFGPFVHEIRDRWRKRVEAQGWPTFLSH